VGRVPMSARLMLLHQHNTVAAVREKSLPGSGGLFLCIFAAISSDTSFYG